METDGEGLSITPDPENFEYLVEQALDKGSGSWENAVWLP